MYSWWGCRIKINKFEGHGSKKGCTPLGYTMKC